jgi:hypothetical protein
LKGGMEEEGKGEKCRGREKREKELKGEEKSERGAGEGRKR